MTCKNALVVFDEIPPRRKPLSQVQYTFYFGVYFVLFLALSAWFRRSGNPPSVIREIDSVFSVLGLLISGVFLLTAKSATPETNQARHRVFFIAMMPVLIILDVLRDVLR